MQDIPQSLEQLFHVSSPPPEDAFQLVCWSQRGEEEDSGTPGLPSGWWKKKQKTKQKMKVSGLVKKKVAQSPDLTWVCEGTALGLEAQPSSQPQALLRKELPGPNPVS